MRAGQEFFNLYNHDFVRTAVAIPPVRVADPDFNGQQIVAHTQLLQRMAWFGGVKVAVDEVFVSDGGKSDSANLQEIFAQDCVVAVMDPVYPVYADSNVIAGRTGRAEADGRYAGITYLPCTAENAFQPALPDKHVDLIYLCYPNNPTGAVVTREALARWVAYARAEEAVILYDAAYEAYISDPGVPHSIYVMFWATDPNYADMIEQVQAVIDSVQLPEGVGPG